MVLPEFDVLLMALVCGGLGAAVVLLVVGLRGGAPHPGRPPGLLARRVAQLRDPALTSRLAVVALVAVVVLLLTGWPAAALGMGALVGFGRCCSGACARSSSRSSGSRRW